MSMRSLKVRLDRLERLIEKIPKEPNKVHPDEFVVDTAIAKAFVQDYFQWKPLENSRDFPGLTKAENEEFPILDKRITSMASGVKLPPGYGRNENYRDHCRFIALVRKSIPLYNTLTEAEANEKNELLTRKIAYLFQSADGRDWRRIEELERLNDANLLTLEEMDELIHLNTNNPPLPLDPYASARDFEAKMARLRKQREDMIKPRKR